MITEKYQEKDFETESMKKKILKLMDLLEDQNTAVASILRTAIKSQDRQERKSGTSDTEEVILKTVAKLNKISGILLK